jgi:undecaprenyl-phosphate 4-deoxy-4-formamido-L-arabinose transferase
MAIVKKLDKYDCCYTIYLKRKHALWKKAISYLNSVFSNFILNKPSSIYISSYRGFKSEIRDKMLLEKKTILFLDALILKFSKNLSAINVRHLDRHEGESNYKILNLFSLWFDMIENFHFYPIRLGSLVGLIFFSFVKIIRINSKRSNKYKINKILK